MSSAISPIQSTQRIVLLDALRGFAIFGILMVNMPLFFSPFLTIIQGSQAQGDTVGVVFESFIKFFFEGKFYVLFSMLFGYGFWLFINRKSPNGGSIIPTFCRRLTILFLFGALHIVLLWSGDILLFYSLAGFILILYRNASSRALVKWAIWLVVIPSILSFLAAGFFALASMMPEAAAELQVGIEEGQSVLAGLIAQANNVYANGSFKEIVEIRLIEYGYALNGFIFFLPIVLGMFLIGVWAARTGIIESYSEHLPFFRKALWWGVGLGIPLNAIYAVSYQFVNMQEPNIWLAISTFTHSLGGFLFCLAYVAGIILLISNGKLKQFTAYLAPVGRMALTNYLLHSIICAILFHSYGFGLFGRVELWHGVILTVIIFALQIPFSRMWLSHFRFGPFEWLWRTLTYLKWQPFRVVR